MSTKADINQDVTDLVNNIISNNKLAQNSTITYNAGTELGDGFLSKTLAVSINDDIQSLELFLKCGLDIKPTPIMPVDKYYANEILFYDVIYPTYLKFVEEKNVEDGFRNTAKCYGTSKKFIIALENLKKKGYVLCNKKKPLNDQHLRLALKTFAKFHAISFAYKDQRREEYDKLIAPTKGVLSDVGSAATDEIYKKQVDEFLASLDPVKDKHILDGTDNLANKLITAAKQGFMEITEDAILTQGDCWCNNMMFLYEDEDKENPVDVILVDWQIIRPCQPIIDVSYFFYTVASQDALDNLRHYLKVYHEELTRQIRKLGSDPDILYPFALMEKQWKEKSKFGVYMAFMLIRMMLSEKDETLDLTSIDFENATQDDVFATIKNNDEYFRRMKILVEHMVVNEFL